MSPKTRTTILFTLQLVALFVTAAAPSPWLKRAEEGQIGNHHHHDHWRRWGPGEGCRKRPWTCNPPGEWPPAKKCCKNVCIDVRSDPQNCGFCGARCPFSWRCCSGRCRNTNLSPFNCGRCGNVCPFGVPCFYGMCGYSQPFPPHPKPPKRPKPPKPPMPPPFPPKPPKPPPFPPKPPCLPKSPLSGQGDNDMKSI